MAKRSTSSGYEEPKGGLTATELRALIIEILAGVKHGDWANKVGAVEVRPTWANPHSNWRVAGDGSDADVATIAAAVEVVRAQHPYAKA